jgi:hypothetical protein
MSAGTPNLDPSARDRLVRRVRHAGRLLAVATAGATTVFSVVAAHAFRGHNGKSRTRRAVAATTPAPRVRVPPPQHVPAIAGAPPPLQPPAEPPASAPAPAPATSAPAPAPAPAPETSGGS